MDDDIVFLLITGDGSRGEDAGRPAVFRPGRLSRCVPFSDLKNRSLHRHRTGGASLIP